MLDVHHMKLYGSFDLPWGLVGSFFYRHANGTPFNRTMTIAAPAEWAAANNALTWDVWVNLEPRGKRRNQFWQCLPGGSQRGHSWLTWRDGGAAPGNVAGLGQAWTCRSNRELHGYRSRIREFRP